MRISSNGLLLLSLVGMASVSLATTGAAAHPRETGIANVATHHSHRKVVKVATAADDDMPRVRIRGDSSGKGLTPHAFARWINRHPALVEQKRVESSVRVLASTAGAQQRRSNAENFDIADTNQDGRVSADELADFVMQQAGPSRVPTDAT